jgi:predicted transcriptional regulator of viral defense system
MNDTFSKRKWLENILNILDMERINVFSRYDLAKLISERGDEIKIPRSISISRLSKVLVEEGGFEEIELMREGRRTSHGSKKRLMRREVSPFEIGLSLRKDSYISHSSAVFLHGLTEQIPKTIYVNKEQSPKPRSRSGLSQPAIDRAFISSPRKSKYVFISSQYRYVLLSGKNTGRLGVSQIEETDRNLIDVTNLERTLIDIVVRPAYSGGIYEILDVYKSVKQRVSVDSLIDMLRKLDYVYPYHQSIGFIMERAGYDEVQLDKLQSIGIKWKFYIDYKIVESEYSERWKLFYPKGL